jgi:hypothetical protein
LLRLGYDCAWLPSQAQTKAKAIGSGTNIREPTYAITGQCVSCSAKRKTCHEDFKMLARFETAQ